MVLIYKNGIYSCKFIVARYNFFKLQPKVGRYLGKIILRFRVKEDKSNEVWGKFI